MTLERDRSQLAFESNPDESSFRLRPGQEAIVKSLTAPEALSVLRIEAETGNQEKIDSFG